MSLKTYYRLTKPGIIYGNVMTAAAGFLFASKWHIDFWLLVSMLVGTSLVIASGCVYNNYLDRNIDKKMERTKKRALVEGVITIRTAIIYATILCLTGFTILIVGTNHVVVLIGLIGLVDYVILYGIGKRKSVYGTLVGSVSGSMPIIAGYCAVTGHFDRNALLLFLIMTCWQMPHFYAIAIYRLKDYTAAGLPVWPAKRGVHQTKYHIVGYMIAYLLAVTSLTVFGSAGYIYLVVMLGMGGAWLYDAVRGFNAPDATKWARKSFFFSLLVVMTFSASVAFGSILP